MQRILDEVFLTSKKNKARLQRPPTHERKIYTDPEGNELWLRIYQDEDGYTLATVVTKFPQYQVEVETEYDVDHYSPDEDPVKPCVGNIIYGWGCQYFIEFHRTYYLKKIAG